MSGLRNKFIREKQNNGKTVMTTGVRKGRKFRTELEPFLGATVNMVCATFSHKRSIVSGKPCIQILLQHPQIVKVPANLSRLDLPNTSHLWVTVDTGWETYIQNANYLWLRGFLYEYVHCGYKNIGFQVLRGKAYSNKPSD